MIKLSKFFFNLTDFPISQTTARRPVPLPATDQHQDGKEDITHWDECHNGDDDRWIGIFILTIFCQFCEFNFHKRQTW